MKRFLMYIRTVRAFISGLYAIRCPIVQVIHIYDIYSYIVNNRRVKKHFS